MQPAIFVGSSVEGKDVANAIQLGLHHEADVTVWHQAFPLSLGTVDTLLTNVGNNDFAVFVFSPDDQLSLRSDTYEIARDNVVFEAGLFIGAHGRDRTFIVSPKGNPKFHIPSDLLGITTASYDPDFARRDVNAALGAAVTLISQAMNIRKANLRPLFIKCFASYVPQATWPHKVHLSVSNIQSYPVVLESVAFDVAPDLPLASDAELDHGIYIPKFRVGKNGDRDVYERFHILQPGKAVEAWIPIDRNLKLAHAQERLKAKAAGVWRYRVQSLAGHTFNREYRTTMQA